MAEKPLCEKLRTLRQNSGFTQLEVANLLCCSRSTYTYYETGKTEPSLPVVKMLAKIYNIPLLELLEEEEPPHAMHDSGRRPQVKTVPFDRIRYIYDLSPEERELIGFFRICDSDEKKQLNVYCNEMHKNMIEE